VLAGHSTITPGRRSALTATDRGRHTGGLRQQRRRLHVPALSAEHAWVGLQVGVEVQLIRSRSS
jgi:hypothetical protein